MYMYLYQLPDELTILATIIDVHLLEAKREFLFAELVHLVWLVSKIKPFLSIHCLRNL